MSLSTRDPSTTAAGRPRAVPDLPVALSVGDPSGIGPEIAVKARDRLGAGLAFFWIADPAHLPPGTRIREIARPAEAVSVPSSLLPVLPLGFPAAARPGRPSPENAAAVIEAIATGVRLVMAGEAAALCTAPINKKALKDGAGFAFPGHTEYLAHLAGVRQVVMMLACPELRVVPTTIHIPLAEVPRRLTAGLLADTLSLTHAALRRDFGIASPRIAVAGLNPHAGEGGTIGKEEIQVITPAIRAAQKEGLPVEGPYPADTVFHAAARGEFAAVVAMYHDQGLAPLKLMAFDEGVNVTLGLPIVRTSPDHGTAFAIAGKNCANPSSMIEAIRHAAAIGKRPNPWV